MSNLEPRDHVYLSNFQRLVKVQVEPHRCVLWFDDGSLITVQSVGRRGSGDPSLGVSIEQQEGRPSFTRETRALYQCSCGFPCCEAGKGCPQCGQPGCGPVDLVRSELDQPLVSTGQSETEAGREVGNADAAEAGRPVGWAHMQKPLGGPGRLDWPPWGPTEPKDDADVE